MKKLAIKLSKDLIDETFKNVVKVIELEHELEGFLTSDLTKEFHKYGIQYSVLNDTLRQLQAFKQILNDEDGD